MALYVGISPMQVVAAPMTRRVVTRTNFRPCRSPSRPKTIPPSGLARNPTANVAMLARKPTVGETLGKNSLLKTIAAPVL